MSVTKASNLTQLINFQHSHDYGHHGQKVLLSYRHLHYFLNIRLREATHGNTIQVLCSTTSTSQTYTNDGTSSCNISLHSAMCVTGTAIVSLFSLQQSSHFNP